MTTSDFTVDEFVDRLDQWSSDVLWGDHTEFLERCKVPVAEMFTEIFSTAVDSTGNGWAPHAPSTIAAHGPHPLLILTSALYQSLTDGNAHHYEMVSDNSLEWGTTVVYAGTQNYGNRNIPAREFMYINQSGADAIENLAGDYLSELVTQF